MTGRANKHHGELAYIRKRTWWSNTTMITMSWNLWNYLLACIKIINKLQNNEFIDSQEYIHIRMEHVRFHTLWRDQYTKAHVAWSTVSYTRASFVPIIFRIILMGNKHHFGYLSLRLETMHYKTHSSKWFAMRPSQQTAAQTCTNHKFHPLDSLDNA